MKKLFFIVAAVVTMAGCGNSGRSEAQQRELDSLQHIIDMRDDEVNELMGCVAEVQDGIRRINEAEGRITIAEGNAERTNSRAIIRENMEYIEEAMRQNRETLAQLQERLKNSSIKSDKLQKTVANLQEQIAQQSQRIQELEAELAEKDLLIAQQGERIDSLSGSVDELTADNLAKQKTLDQQEQDLNKAWFVFGTKTELKEQKILQAGDVLKSDNFNRDYFTQLDIRYDKEIKFYSKNVKLLTSHPAGTYQLVKDAKGEYELHITQPEKFWSVSKFLVVQVK